MARGIEGVEYVSTGKAANIRATVIARLQAVRATKATTTMAATITSTVLVTYFMREPSIPMMRSG